MTTRNPKVSAIHHAASAAIAIQVMKLPPCGLRIDVAASALRAPSPPV